LESLKLERLKDLKRIETLEEKITALERENAMLKKQNNDKEQRYTIHTYKIFKKYIYK
jgi:hypothetical protein